MDIYTTEEQQAEAIKKWIKDNGAAVVIGIVLGLAGLKGWDYWKERNLRQHAQASTEYEAILPFIDKASVSELETQLDAFATRNDANVYYDFLQFKLAKKAIAENNLEAAASAFRRVIKNPAHEVIDNIARYRLARIAIAQNKPQQALDLLNKETDAFKYLFSEVRGDAFLALGQNEKARQAYLVAQESLKGNGQDQTLEMKINDLTVINNDEKINQSPSQKQGTPGEKKSQTQASTPTEVEKE